MKISQSPLLFSPSPPPLLPPLPPLLVSVGVDAAVGMGEFAAELEEGAGDIGGNIVDDADCCC